MSKAVTASSSVALRPESGTVSNQGFNKSTAPPPRPKSAAPPPRPKRVLSGGDPSLLASALLPVNPPEWTADATTGFGEWTQVEAEITAAPQDVRLLPLVNREIPRSFEVSVKDDSRISKFGRPVVKKIKRRIIEED